MWKCLKYPLFIVLIYVFTLSPTQAQDHCGNLTASDCAMLEEAQRATSAVPSGAFKLTADFTVSARFIGDIIRLNIATDGVYTRTQIPENAELDPLYASLLGLNADMSLYIHAEVSPLLVTGETRLITGLDLRYDAGIGYAELSKLEAVGGWYSVDIAQIIARLIRENILPREFAQTPLIDEQALNLWAWLATISTPQRLADIEHNGETFAVFEVALLMGDYLDSDASMEASVRETLSETARSLYSGTPSTAQLNDTTGLLLAYFRSIRLATRQWVADGLIHNTFVEIEFKPDSRITRDFPNDASGLSLLGDFELSFTLNFRHTQFGDVPLVVIPENATPLRFEDLFGPLSDFSPF